MSDRSLNTVEAGAPTVQANPFRELCIAAWLEAAFSRTIFSNRLSFYAAVARPR